ncbi:MAG: hypothetical protein U0528_01390 [Anaerolineae bacterium]
MILQPNARSGYYKINIEDKGKEAEEGKGGKRRIRVIKGLPQIINN